MKNKIFSTLCLLAVIAITLSLGGCYTDKNGNAHLTNAGKGALIGGAGGAAIGAIAGGGTGAAIGAGAGAAAGALIGSQTK